MSKCITNLLVTKFFFTFFERMVGGKRHIITDAAKCRALGHYKASADGIIFGFINKSELVFTLNFH
jgi:hypothetical protein